MEHGLTFNGLFLAFSIISAAGIYSVEVTDSNNCQFTQSVD